MPKYKFLLTESEILEKEDLYFLQDGLEFKYKLTQGELDWLEFIKGKYAIYDWIKENLDGDVLDFKHAYELTEILEGDGIENKAVMLSDDSALQRIFFWIA